MSTSVRRLAIQALLDRREKRANRYVDMRLTVVYRGEPLISVGGLWDSLAKQYVRDADEFLAPKTERRIEVIDAQIELMRWYVDWLRRYIEQDWDSYTIPYTGLMFGARGGGKTWAACLCMALFAVAKPGSLQWAASPTEDKTEELRKELGSEDFRSIMPAAWFRYYEDDMEFRLANGSVIAQKSGHLRLRQGRVDLVMLNEAQLMHERVYRDVRGAITKASGGLVLATANPPDDAKGKWVETLARDAMDPESDRRAVSFLLDPRRNPFSSTDAIVSMSHDMSEADYKRDVLGMLVPLGIQVWPSFDERENVRADLSPLQDITRAVTQRLFGKPYDRLMSWDFDKEPWIAAVGARVFGDDPNSDDVTILIEQELFAENKDEGEAIDMALSMRHDQDDPLAGQVIFTKERTICIGDASGDYQGTKRLKGMTSFRYFERERWRIVPPSPKQKSNPRREQTIKITGAAFCSYTDRRRLYIHPRCKRTIEAVREWPRGKTGEPMMKSKYAHVCAAVRYLVYRLLLPRSPEPSSVGMPTTRPPRSGGWPGFR